MPRAKTPAAEYKKLMLRLPDEALQAITRIAEENHRSMNAQILHVLLDWLAKEHKHGSPRSKKS
jgi:hypothetical protein